jgi:hypothetical protein
MALPFTFKSRYLKAKRRIMESSNVSPYKKNIIFKKSSKKSNPNPLRY